MNHEISMSIVAIYFVHLYISFCLVVNTIFILIDFFPLFFSTPAKRHRKAANDAQPPTEAKLLDDLFRRTKASPSIYWLPLSAEQV